MPETNPLSVRTGCGMAESSGSAAAAKQSASRLCITSKGSANAYIGTEYTNLSSNGHDNYVYRSEEAMEPSRTKPNVFESIAAGAIGGLIAALAMNKFQAAVAAVGESMSRIEHAREQTQEQQKQVSSGDDATVKTANAIATAVFHHKLTTTEKKWAGPVVHYGMGAKLGALYGALAPSIPIEAGAGMGYGAAVWVGADEIAVPLFGLSKLPVDTPLSAHVNALASHLVFGLVLHFTRKMVLS